MKKLLFSLLLVPAYNLATAQMGMGMKNHMESLRNDSNFTISGYKNLGVSFAQFDNLNDRIKNNSDYKQLPDAMATIGIGGIIKKNHFVTANALMVGYSWNGNKDKKSTSLGFIGGSADWGYNFFTPSDRFQLYPTVGLGVEGYRTRLNEDNSSTSFNSLLGDNTETSETSSLVFKNIFLAYRFGLNFEGKSKKYGCSFGLQAGYTGGFNGRSWRINDGQKLNNAPSDNLSRIYANLFMTKELNWKKAHM